MTAKTQAQRAQEQNRAQSPTGTACLIGNPDIWDALPVALPPPPALPSPPKHPRWVYNVSFLPKYKFSNPKPAQQRAHYPITTADIVYIYLLLSPTPAQQPHPIIHPRPPIRHPRQANYPTRLPKVSITNPNQPQHHGRGPFFGWWGIPGVDL